MSPLTHRSARLATPPSGGRLHAGLLTPPLVNERRGVERISKCPARWRLCLPHMARVARWSKGPVPVQSIGGQRTPRERPAWVFGTGCSRPGPRSDSKNGPSKGSSRTPPGGGVSHGAQRTLGGGGEIHGPQRGGRRRKMNRRDDGSQADDDRSTTRDGLGNRTPAAQTAHTHLCTRDDRRRRRAKTLGRRLESRAGRGLNPPHPTPPPPTPTPYLAPVPDLSPPLSRGSGPSAGRCAKVGGAVSQGEVGRS